MPSNTPYDATTRVLLGTRPQDWLAFLGLPPDAPVELLDTDLSTVSAAADGVLRVGGNAPEVLHIEFESGHTGKQLPRRLLRYGVLLADSLNLPVRSVAILLSKEANSPELSGELRQTRPNGATYLTFQYEVIRVWKTPAEQFLNAGLSLLPLAPIADVAEADLPDLLSRMDERVEAAKADQIITEDAARELWTATYVLMGLKYDRALNQKLLQGVMQMRNSVTYQAIVEEGLAEGLSKGRDEGLAEGRTEGREAFQTLIRRVGDKRYGVAPQEIIAALEKIDSLQRLERLGERLWEAESWDELLATQ